MALNTRANNDMQQIIYKISCLFNKEADKCDEIKSRLIGEIEANYACTKKRISQFDEMFTELPKLGFTWL